MSDATTGVPAANASVRTMPNDSPPSDGAHSTSARASACVLRVVVDAAERRRRPRASASSGASSAASHADHRELGGDVLAQRLEGAQQDRQPLALDRLADEGDPQRLVRHARGAAPGRRRRAASTPLGTIRYSPPKKRRPVHSAASDTAMRTRRRLRLRREPQVAAIACGRKFSV